MLLTAFFRDRGVPKTGLSPTISISESDGTLVVDAQDMIERGGTKGFYDFDFINYANVEDYAFLADAGPSLSAYDRYAYGTNEDEYDTELEDNKTDIATNLQLLKKIWQYIPSAGAGGSPWSEEEKQKMLKFIQEATKLDHFEMLSNLIKTNFSETTSLPNQDNVESMLKEITDSLQLTLQMVVSLLPTEAIEDIENQLNSKNS